MGIMKKRRNKKIEHELNELGFIRAGSSPHAIMYHRYNKIFSFMQVVVIGEKESGIHMIHSYSLEDNVSVGLTGIEMTLFLKKMKAMGWYSRVPSTGL